MFPCNSFPKPLILKAKQMYDFFIYLLQFTEHICYNISRTNDPQINVLQGDNAMNYILGAFLLGTSAYCWKNFTERIRKAFGFKSFAL